MRIVSRVDEETGETVVWCGDDFNPMAMQEALQESGLSLVTIRDDKWAVVGPIEEVLQENNDGR